MATSAASATLSTSMSVPTTMRNPTVALAYWLEGTAPNGSTRLKVAVVSDATTTALFEGRATDWTLGWGDLSPWAGQNVTLQLTLRQAAGEPTAHLYVDSITLTDWLTPVVTSTTPAQLPFPWAGQTVTLHGDNFLDVPQMWVGSVAIPNMQRLDDWTLRIVLPATLGPGRHDIRLRDGTSRQSIGLTPLQLGEAVFAPLIHR